VTSSSPKDIGLKVLVECIRLSLLNLNARFYHVYRSNNFEADVMDNRAIGKDLGIMGVYGVECMVIPP
jgi:hypothetical protein